MTTSSFLDQTVSETTKRAPWSSSKKPEPVDESLIAPKITWNNVCTVAKDDDPNCRSRCLKRKHELALENAKAMKKTEEEQKEIHQKILDDATIDIANTDKEIKANARKQQ